MQLFETDRSRSAHYGFQPVINYGFDELCPYTHPLMNVCAFSECLVFSRVNVITFSNEPNFALCRPSTLTMN